MSQLNINSGLTTETAPELGHREIIYLTLKGINGIINIITRRETCNQ